MSGEHTSTAQMDGASAAPPGVAAGAFRPSPAQPREPHVGGTVLREGQDQEDFDREVFRRLSAGHQATRMESEPETPEGRHGGPTPGMGGVEPSQPVSRSTDPPVESPHPDRPAEPSTDGEDGAQARLDREIAVATLRRDGFPTKWIDQFLQTASPDDVAATVAVASKRQSGYDRLGNELRDLKKQLERGREDTDHDYEEPEDHDHRPRASRGDDDAFLTPSQRRLIERLRDVGDDETAEAHLEVFREQAGQRRSGAGEPAGEIDPRDVVGRLREPITRLADSYPQLADEDARIELVATADRMIAAGVFDLDDQGVPTAPIDEILERAAGVKFGAPPVREHQRRMATSHHTQRNGQPTRGDLAGSGGPAFKTTEEADRWAYRQIQQGRSPTEVNKELETRMPGVR